MYIELDINLNIVECRALKADDKKYIAPEY